MAANPASLEAMAMARMTFLSARERIALAEALGLRLVLRALSVGAVEEIVGRRLAGAAWEPEAWLAMARADADWLEAVGASSYSYFDDGYPAMLRETSRPPFMLYVRGGLPSPSAPALAIVGTRFPTGRGMETASALAREAALSGVPVVSGLARGIDAAAHRGALAGSGPTFAVLGRGIDEIYPLANKDLAARMVAAGGGILSEYPPGVPPSRWTFPERNRILAGLCRSTLVVEAPRGSGALISAAFALEEGRDVYVAAGCEGGPRSAGSDALRADGAPSVATFGEISREWRGNDARGWTLGDQHGDYRAIGPRLRPIRRGSRTRRVRASR